MDLQGATHQTDNFRMNRLAPRLVQPLVRGTFTRNVTQTRNLTSKTNLLRPVVKVLFLPQTYLLANIREISQTALLENSSNCRFYNFGHDIDRINGEFIHYNLQSIKHVWMSFPLIRFCPWPGKLKLRNNFWMSFPGFANKGFANPKYPKI